MHRPYRASVIDEEEKEDDAEEDITKKLKVVMAVLESLWLGISIKGCNSILLA